MVTLLIDGLEVEVTKKRVKNLSLRVLPPDGRVVMSIPLSLKLDIATTFVKSKRRWIDKQKAKIEERVLEVPKTYCAGEEHFLFGKSYTLNIIGSSSKEYVSVEADFINLYIKDPSNRDRKEQVIEKWYRANLQQILPELIDKWERIIGVSVEEFRIRKMTTRWGTCNPKAKRIWLSLMLAKRRPELIEYIVVHEIVHFLERGHNHRFYKFMDLYLPEWKELRKELR